MLTKTTVLVMILAAAARTQDLNGPIGVLRGDLMSWAGTSRIGEFTLRNTDNLVYRCSYDDKTYFERENQRITMAGAEKGDRLEVVSDRRQGSEACYARTVHVLDTRPAAVVPGVRPRLHTYHSPTELFAPRGDLTFTGMVLRISADTLILRTRSGERKAIRLRPDTRYSTDGQAAGRESLPVNTRIFVRAGKNLDDEVEAYQIVWGDILQPQ